MYAMANPPSHLSLAETLKSLGLTKYEALVYIALLKAAGATATEIHELSGVPRASVYPVLDRLVRKNLVSVSHTTPRRFDAVRPDEGVDHLLQAVEADAARARKLLAKIYRERQAGEREDQELIWSIHGEDAVRSRLTDMLASATQCICVIMFGFQTGEIRDLLVSRLGAVRIEVITDRWEGPVPPGMKVNQKQPPASHFDALGTSFAGGVFFADGRQVMVVMIARDEGSTALFSESKGFIRFFSLYWDMLSAWAGNR
jgi:sugar-specific transcriptional regulator TrmB